MTERLRQLMHDEVSHLAPPSPDASTVLAQGRRLRRQRTAVTAVGSLTAIGVLCGTAFLGVSVLGGSGPNVLDPAGGPIEGWVVASGQDVLMGNGQRAEVDGTVKSVYYTSAGVLVRKGATATTDAPDSAYSLIAEDGKATSFALNLGDRVPGTDPTLPYLAYAAPGDEPDEWEVVLRDVRTGEVEQTVPVTGSFTWGGWNAPPVSLSGDHVYVGMDESTLDVAWRTGEVTESDVLPPSTLPHVLAGRSVLGSWGEKARVVDAETGEELLTLPATRNTSLMLSLDGGYVLRRPFATCDESNVCRLDAPDVTIYDVASGTQADLDVREAFGIGWTPQGAVVRVDDDSIDVCDPGTGECAEAPAVIDPTDLRVGGSVYES